MLFVNDIERGNMKQQFKINSNDGVITSIIIADDPEQMDWIYKNRGWGELFYRRLVDNWNQPDPLVLVSSEAQKDGSVSVFQSKVLKCTVQRGWSTDGGLTERYTFQNISPTDLFIQTGEFGIILPLCDAYTYAETSLRQCCNAHIWCGESISWVNALRQGSSCQNLGLVLTEGSLDKYSQLTERTGVPSDSPRGRFVLHPEATELLPGEAFSVGWEVFVHSGTEDFLKQLAKKQPITNLRAKQYTVFGGEDMCFELLCEEDDVEVTLEKKAVPFSREGARICVRYTPTRFGEHRFDIRAGKYRTHITMFSTHSFFELVRRRVHFIVDHQQYSREGSALDGAYLLYDNRERRTVFDDRMANRNAARERLGMGLLLARYLQACKDEKVMQSLFRYVEFIKRELFDEETGRVFNTVGKNASYVRLYNAPWVIQFFAEMYVLTKDLCYVEYIHRAMSYYYANGGLHFYPNAIRPQTVYEAVRASGNEEYAKETLAYFKAHADKMLEVGLNYPPHEVVYEQTIVTPAVTFLCEMGILTGEKKYLDGVKNHLECLDRFSGMQPDCRLHGIPIRYWDGYWFGKSALYGDTFPHYWSCLSADAWDDYATLSGDMRYREKAEDCIRNCTVIYDEEGKGSCAYMYPFYIDGVRGEFHDEWSNDQDYALYYLLRILYAGGDL